jgi:ATP-binding protein involved in chromosome partitioning
MGLDVLGRLALVSDVSEGGDGGRPVMIMGGDGDKGGGGGGAEEVRKTMREVGRRVWDWLEIRPRSLAGERG